MTKRISLLVDVECEDKTCGSCSCLRLRRGCPDCVRPSLPADEATCTLFETELEGEAGKFLRCEKCHWAQRFADDPYRGGSPW